MYRIERIYGYSFRELLGLVSRKNFPKRSLELGSFSKNLKKISPSVPFLLENVVFYYIPFLKKDKIV